MEVVLEHLVTLMAGGCVGYIGIRHRGTALKDLETGVNVSKGDGISAWIIDNVCESYRYISASIDHIMWNVGSILIGGGVGGLLISAVEHVFDSAPSNPMIPYIVAAEAVGALNLVANISSVRKRGADLSDILQIAADVCVPLATLYGLYHLL